MHQRTSTPTHTGGAQDSVGVQFHPGVAALAALAEQPRHPPAAPDPLVPVCAHGGFTRSAHAPEVFDDAPAPAAAAVATVAARY